MEETTDRFTNAVIHLHLQKNTAYGNAWKRRGEQISIIANIARKVDRLEQLAAGNAASIDESTFDTAIDLFVYTLKYMTYLADQDQAVAAELFHQWHASATYSDGTEGFDYLLQHMPIGGQVAHGPAHPFSADAAALVLTRFAVLESCFEAPLGTPLQREEAAQLLLDASKDLIRALRTETPHDYHRFLARWCD